MKFKGFMAENKITQAELAELLKIDISNVNLKVNGKQAWTLDQVKTICTKYGISAQKYFF